MIPDPVLLIVIPLVAGFLVPITRLASKKLASFIPLLGLLVTAGLAAWTLLSLDGGVVRSTTGGFDPPWGISLVVTSLGGLLALAILGIGNRPDEYTSEDADIVSYFADVTWEIVNKKKNDETLRQSEDKFSKAFRRNTSIMAINTLDDGRFVDVNDAFLRVLGYEYDKVMGKTLPEIGLIFDERTRETVGALLKNHETLDNLEVKIRTDTGREITGLFSASIISINGRVSWLTVMTDITERKRAEALLTQSEDLYRHLFEAESDAIFLIDNDTGRILKANAAAENLYGYSLDEIHSMKNTGLSAEPEETQRVTRSSPVIKDNIVSIPLRYHKKKDGTVFPVEISGRFFEWRGKPVHIASIRDISERINTEQKLIEQSERLENIIEGTRTGTWQWQVPTGVMVFNERWAEIIGYTLEELSPVSIQTFIDNCHPEDLKQSKALLKKHFSGEIDYYQCEARMRHKNGQWIWVIIRGKVSVRDETGRPLVMSGTHIDINSRKQAEDKLTRALKENENLLKELQHRTKNSFSTIVSIMSLKAGSVTSPEAMEVIEDLTSRIRAASDLYSVLSASGHPDRVWLDAYCGQVVESLSAMHGNITVETGFESINAHPKNAAALGLIITELMTNSIKHAFPNGRRGSVRMSLKREGTNIVLTYSDDGIGLPEKFDMNDTSKMGHRIIMALVEQLNGTLTCKGGKDGHCRIVMPDLD